MKSLIEKKYQFIKQIVCDEGYEKEIDWQSQIEFKNIDESYFLKELSWVILSSGMKEQIIRRIFYEITPYFYNWKSAKKIVKNKQKCFSRSIKLFNNEKKISAIIDSAEIINKITFEKLKKQIEYEPIEILKEFPFIGNITAYHLAKNIGINVAKPDRHLVRIANDEGFNNVQEFCELISELSGDSVPVVDIVLWRFANLHKNYLDVLSSVNFSHQEQDEIEYEQEVFQ